MRWWQRRKREQDLERELQDHLNLEKAEQQENGLTPEEASAAAQRAFGNSTLVKEATRETWGWGSLERLAQDSAYALRLFRKSPGFTAIVIFTLALGIGANTAVFSVVNAVLFHPLPYRNPDRLVAVWDREIHAKGTSKLFDLYSDYGNWKKNGQSFQGIAAVSWSPQASPEKTLKGHGPARSIFALPVTPDFFSLLGVPARLGRTFNERDMGRGCLVVLADGFWQKVFGGEKAIVGKSIRLDQQACLVLGVMPPDFGFLPPEAPVAMWTIMEPPSRPDQFAVAVFARLRSNTSLATAQSEVLLLHRHLHEHDLWGTQMEPVLYGLHDEFTWLTGRNLKLSLIVMFSAVSFVLLICCVNVANLLLGRAVGREREMAIRAVLGSGRGRLLRQLLTENLLLSLAASITGVAFAALALQYLGLVRPIELPPGTKLALSVEVLAFTALLSVATALAFGLVPGWRASRINLNQVLKVAGRAFSQNAQQQRFSKALIVAEIMLTAVLLASAGMLIQTLIHLASAPLGFRPNGLLTTSLQLPQTGYQEPDRRIQFYQQVQTNLSQIPGVEGVALSSVRPVNGGGEMNVVEIQGHPSPRLESLNDTYQQTISPDYFSVMGVPLLGGRSFKWSDRESTEPVTIVNEALVRKYFPNEDPIGKHIRPFTGNKDGSAWLRIIGVVSNEKRTTVYQEMAWADFPVLYRPLAQNPPNSAHIVVRVNNLQGSAVYSNIQRKIAGIDPDLPIEEVVAVNDLESKAMAYPRFRAVLLGSFAGMALVLAVVGLFGVLSQSVGRRIQEIGVRMALGAQKTTVMMMILKEGLLMVGSGAVLGVAVAWLLGHYLSALLYGVRPADPFLLTTITLVLLSAALVAMYLPARRATRIDPMEALRHE